jgi:glycosyltransferase involved in cell wall biosynthesis
VRAVDVVVPDGIDDPERPSGGNTYDRRLCEELLAAGWPVRTHAVGGFWTHPETASFDALRDVLDQIPADGVVLVDGLIASTAPEVLVPRARRLRMVVLVHMPLGHRPEDDRTREREGAVLSAAATVLTTSAWARYRLIELYGLPGDRVQFAEPGVDAAELATGTESGESLLCVASVSFEKGHDVLLAALESISDLSWHCVCVGRLDRDPAFAESLSHDSRISFPGPLTGSELDRAYAAADVLLLASRGETYGMVVTEALARGLPVIAAEVGGVTEALCGGADGGRPGLLVAPEDPQALGSALRCWLCDAGLRARLRRAARSRRQSLRPWSTTAAEVWAVLAKVSG